MKSSPALGKKGGTGFTATLLVLAAVLLLLLGCGFLPGNTLFSNDGPLGRLMSQCHQLPDRFFGCWQDLDGIGYSEGSASPSISFGLQWLLGPLWFSRLYTPASVLVLGLAAWCFFRKAGLASPACFLGAIAAALNSTFFSTACWGLGAHVLTVAMSFLALAALIDTSPRGRWRRVMLAGLAVGMGVMEGADVGAIFSLYVAAFILWQAATIEGPRVRQLGGGLARLALVAVCAALLAARAISELVATNITGVAGTQQDAMTRAARWDWATQWSFPKKEALGVIVPGLFGYRMQTPNGGNYWGAIGRAPDWDTYLAKGSEGTPPNGFLRYSGNGFYAGVPVIMLALWAAVESLRRKDSAFNLSQRKWLWFWLGTGLISLLLAFGRYAPLYRLIYALPYFSTIRNPTKFLHLFSFALVILFAYGMDGLARRYFRPPATAGAPWTGFVSWWTKANRNEKRWLRACALVLAGSLLAWMVYASYSQMLEHYLQTVRFKGLQPHNIAIFSIGQVGWFVFFWALAAGFIALTFSGAFAGRRARRGVILLAVLLILDLGRANLPWIIVLDYQDEYASNPILEKLREHPNEQRVALPPFRSSPQMSGLFWLYESAWLEHQFPYYNIQSLDVIQMSRMPVDLKSFGTALTPPPDKEAEVPRILGRRWQLTNTRYLIAATNFLDFLEQVDPVRHRFRLVERFDVLPKPGILRATLPEQLTAAPAERGAFALFEYSGSLPRAKLYANWQVNTNAQAVLEQLTSPAFDPEQIVLVTGEVPLPANTAGAATVGGTVESVTYASKHVVLKCDAPQPSVLLLNDHFDPHWKVSVDGRQRTLLRCNYVMRGVYLEPGVHTVEFRFQPPVQSLYVSLATIGAGLGLLAFAGVSGYRHRATTPVPEVRPAASPGREAPRQPAKKTGRGKRLASKGAS